jgi:choline dehydrogenase-like flavoprotein
MIIDAKKLPPNFTVEAEVCIVGAGAAGITLARDLAGSNRKVVLLEGGDLTYTAESQHLYAGEVIGHSSIPLDADRLRFFGGTTNHWAGSCMPFWPSEFESWPFGRETLEPCYRRAQIICQLGRYSYDPEDWSTEQAHALKFPSGSNLESGMFQYSPPTRFGTVYRDELASSPNVTVYLNANLIDIETAEGGREVTRLHLACLNSKRFQARARRYVLAAGGVENARLLLVSSKVRAAGLGNEYDLVGRYFQDHPYVQGAATITADSARPDLLFYTQHFVGKTQIEGYVRATDEVLQKEQLPRFAIGIRALQPLLTDFGGLTLPAALRKRLSDDAANSLTYFVQQLRMDVESTWDYVRYKVWRKPQGLFTTQYICGTEPDPQSRVTLGNSVDALGMRRSVLDWRLPADFEIKMRRAHELLGEELGRMGVGRLRLESAATGYDPMQALSNGHHQMGTTRMHRDPRQGVVDENCRVHSLANLYIAGSSVFPTYACDDPTMTIVALALRLSDHLQSLPS